MDLTWNEKERLITAFENIGLALDRISLAYEESVRQAEN